MLNTCTTRWCEILWLIFGSTQKHLDDALVHRDPYTFLLVHVQKSNFRSTGQPWRHGAGQKGTLGKLVPRIFSFIKKESLGIEDDHGNWRLDIITCMTDASLVDTLARTYACFVHGPEKIYCQQAQKFES